MDPHAHQGAQEVGVHAVWYDVLPDAVSLFVAASAAQQVALVERSVVQKGGDFDFDRATVGIGEGGAGRPAQPPRAAAKRADLQPRVLAGAAGTVGAEFDDEVAGRGIGLRRDQLVEDQVAPR